MMTNDLIEKFKNTSSLELESILLVMKVAHLHAMEFILSGNKEMSPAVTLAIYEYEMLTYARARLVETQIYGDTLLKAFDTVYLDRINNSILAEKN